MRPPASQSFLRGAERARGERVFIFTGVPGILAPIEIDAERIMRNLVLNNQVICGTVNAGRAAFEEGVQDLASFLKRFPAAVIAMITARVVLDDARHVQLLLRPVQRAQHG